LAAYEKNLAAALSHSPFIKFTLDTGHFTAFGGDAVAPVSQHHDRVANLHLKDRLRRAEDRNDENTTEWGKDTPPSSCRSVRAAMHAVPDSQEASRGIAASYFSLY
jgi:sugar phosphate isomerase/epimerase